MAENITLTNIATFQNDTTATTAVNANNAQITSALTDTLSRSGTAPNQMQANLDMNSHRLLNLPDAVNNSDPVTLGQVIQSHLGSVVINQPQITGFPVFNVKATGGAVGDGTTDDTTSINNTIALFNSAGHGILYFPAGSYLVSASLSVITANGIIKGDGMGALDGITGAGSLIKFSSGTTTLFTITNDCLSFQDIAMQCTAGLPSAGTAVKVTRTGRVFNGTTISGQKVDFLNVGVKGFFDNLDIQAGQSWLMSNCFIVSAIRYGVRIRNTVNADEGDWAISSCTFDSNLGANTSAIRIESSGGGKIVNSKINGLETAGIGWDIGIDVASSGGTADLLVSNCSIENYNVSAIKMVGPWPGTVINNIEMLTFTGVNSAISLTGMDSVLINNVVAYGNFPQNVVSCSGCTNIHLNGVTGGHVVGTGIISERSFDNTLATDRVTTTSTTGSANQSTVNDTGKEGKISTFGSVHNFTNLRSKCGILSDNNIVLLTDQALLNAGTHDIQLQPGGLDGSTEVLRILAPSNGSQVQFQHANNFSANGAVATALGSIGPTGSRTTVQKWLTIKDGAGNPFYLPCF